MHIYTPKRNVCTCKMKQIHSWVSEILSGNEMWADFHKPQKGTSTSSEESVCTKLKKSIYGLSRSAPETKRRQMDVRAKRKSEATLLTLTLLWATIHVVILDTFLKKKLPRYYLMGNHTCCKFCSSVRVKYSNEFWAGHKIIFQIIFHSNSTGTSAFTTDGGPRPPEIMLDHQNIHIQWPCRPLKHLALIKIVTCPKDIYKQSSQLARNTVLGTLSPPFDGTKHVRVMNH